MTALRVGIAGTGMIAPYHVGGLAALGGRAEVVGVCSHAPDTPALRDLSARYGVPAYAGFAQLIADPQVDAVVIATVNALHEEQVRAAVAAGRHVLVEKPVVTDPAALARLAPAVAARPDVVVMPAHNFRHRPAFVRARELVVAAVEGRAVRAEGGDVDGGWRLGRVVAASFTSHHTISEAHASGWRSRLTDGGGGALMDSGHHQTYQALACFGRPWTVWATTRRQVRTGMEGEDLAHAVLGYGDDADPLVTLTQGWGTDAGDDVAGMRVTGTHGRLTLTDDLYLDGVPQGLDASYEGSFAGQAAAFVDAVEQVRSGAATPADPLAGLCEAEDTLLTVLTAYESARSGAVTALPRGTVRASAR